MRAFDFDAQDSQLPPQTRINSILILIVAVGMFAVGLYYRNNALTATVVFQDELNGISAQLPANWLISTEASGSILRVEDVGGSTFNTVIQISIQTVGPDATSRNVVDQLSVQGPFRFPSYGLLETRSVRLGEDEATQIEYYYVASESNPFLETIPVVVQGVDLVVIRGNQAIIFTFQDDQRTFEDKRRYFDRFLTSVEY